MNEQANHFAMELAKRLRQRMLDMGMTPARLAALLDVAPQRVGQYRSGKRTPDHVMLRRIAALLETSVAALTGEADDMNQILAAVLARVLELDGLPADRAQLIAQVTAEAMRVAVAFPDDAEPLTRARMAGQAAWQLTGGRSPPR